MHKLFSPRKQSVLFLTKYDEAGASSRYRTYQYLPFLTHTDYTVSPLLTKKYIESRFRRRYLLQLGLAIKAYIKRTLQVLQAPFRYHLLVIEYELLPYCPAWLESYLHWWKTPYIVDYDDALFHQYDQHNNLLLKKLFGGKIAKVMRLSHRVVAGNTYLANYARCAGAKTIDLLPTVIDLRLYEQANHYAKSALFTLVWIGSPTTSVYLREVFPALLKLKKSVTFRLRLIGARPVELPGIAIEQFTWQADKEVQYISQCHVGIMPLPDTPWAQGKCGFKLIQYMACGLPVVASPVGANVEIIQSDNGFLAKETDEWVHSLKKLATQPALCKTMGEAGKTRIANTYCLQRTVKKFQAGLKEK